MFVCLSFLVWKNYNDMKFYNTVNVLSNMYIYSPKQRTMLTIYEKYIPQLGAKTINSIIFAELSTRVIIRVKASIMPGIFVKNMIKHVLTLFKTHFWCDEICFMTRLENDEVKRRWHVMPWVKLHDMVTLTRKKVWQRPSPALMIWTFFLVHNFLKER